MTGFQLRARKGICNMHCHSMSQCTRDKCFEVLRVLKGLDKQAERGSHGVIGYP